VGERGQKRRRLRERRRVREALLLDLGALVYELHRQGRRAPELLQQKAAELTVVDEEVRELQAELDGVEAAEPTDETAEFDALAHDGEPPEDDLAEHEPEEHELEQDGPDEDDGLEDEDTHEQALAEHEEPSA
jgi:hypothetical protein